MLEILKFLIFPNNEKVEKIFSNTEKKKFILGIILNIFPIFLVCSFIFLLNFEKINLHLNFILELLFSSIILLIGIIILNGILFGIIKFILKGKGSFSDLFLILGIFLFIHSFGMLIIFSYIINLIEFKILAFIGLFISTYSIIIFIFLLNKILLKNWLKTICLILIIIGFYIGIEIILK